MIPNPQDGITLHHLRDLHRKSPAAGQAGEGGRALRDGCPRGPFPPGQDPLGTGNPPTRGDSPTPGHPLPDWLRMAGKGSAGTASRVDREEVTTSPNPERPPGPGSPVA